MPLITLRNISLGFGSPSLFENLNLSINAGERVCLIGRNGVGKSSLLKLINGDIEPDSGQIECQQSTQISMLQQAVPNELRGNIFEIVAASQHHANTQQLETWQSQYQIEAILSKLELDGELAFSDLSGGLKRRVLLAAALVTDPDILLLDEPTNHLDIEAIAWLEKFLLQFKKTLIFVTHDRILMQKIATHIVEIDNGQLTSWRGHYQAYLKHKQTALEAEQKAAALFEKRLGQEEAWIRQGIKARRTRNEGRVRSLKKMREQYQQRRIRPGQAKLTQQDVSYSGKIIFEANHISYAYEANHSETIRNIIKDFSTVLLRGDKVGVIGANGSGKSTLLNLLLQKLQPSQGSIKYGTQLEVAYYDQHRQQLDESKTVLDNVAEGSTTITIGDKQKHIISYLQDFLFSPQRARSPVKSLSGGERNRVMLAKLFSKPSNVLVLDEPTNDLDVETLELLEEQLLNYTGTLLLVSHDRAFLNNVVTSTLVMEDNGQVGEYVGGYDDWLRQCKTPKTIENERKPLKSKPSETIKKSQKLSYKEKRELETLPQTIEKLEEQQQQLQQQLANPELYKANPHNAAQLKQQLDSIEKKLAIAFERWESLDQDK